MVSLVSGGDSNTSALSRLGEAFDPTTYIHDAIGGDDAWSPHDVLNPIADYSNEQFSKVAAPLNQFMTTITPGKQYIDDNVPILKQWNETVENRPVDAAGIAAATIFSGGALAGAGGAGAAAGTGGTLGGAGTAAAGSAITPAFASGLGATTAGAGYGGLGAAGTAYGSAALGGASAAGAGAAATAAGGGIGGLGAAGTAAGTTALTPSLASLGTQQSLGSYMSQLYDKANTVKDYYDKGRQVYDLFNPEEEQQQSLSEPMRITNPLSDKQRYSSARFLRGY